MGGSTPAPSVSHSVLSDSVTPWTLASQAPLSMEFSSKNTGVGCYFFLLEIFLTHGIELESPLSHALQVDSLPTEPSINSQ